MRQQIIRSILLASMASIPSSASSQWIQTNGPFGGGLIHSMLFQDSILYAGTGSGMYWSKDYGAYWSTTTNDLSESAVHSIVLVDTTLLACAPGSGVLRSVDQGASWVPVTTGLTSLNIRWLTRTPSHVFAGSGDGKVFRSTDLGSTWALAVSGLPAVPMFGLGAIDTVVLAGLGGQSYRSTNNGDSWSAAGTGLSSYPRYCYVAEDSVVYTGWVGFFRSVDYGLTWTPMNSGLINDFVKTITYDEQFLYAGTTGGIFRMAKSETTWTQKGPYDVVSAVTGGGRLFAGTKEGLFVSSDQGDSWAARDSGRSYKGVSGWASLEGTIYGATRWGVFSSTDGGGHWALLDSGLQHVILTAITRMDTLLLVGSQDGHLFRSSDRGLSWVPADSGFDNGSVSGMVVAGSNILTATRATGSVPGAVYRSSDRGESWEVADPALVGDSHYSIAADSTTVVTATDFHVFRSLDAGISWDTISIAQASFGGAVGLAIDGATIVAASIDDGIFQSTDLGGTWMQSNAGLSSLQVTGLCYKSPYAYLGTDSGFYFLKDGDTAWISANEALGKSRVGSMMVEGSFVYASTGTTGVWRRPVADLTTGTPPVDRSVPSTYQLFQNYPNPFNPTTEITYNLPVPDHIRIQIIDVLGRVVATLFEGRQSPGTRTLVWDASDFPSGTYFCLMTAGSFGETRKMLLIR